MPNGRTPGMESPVPVETEQCMLSVTGLRHGGQTDEPQERIRRLPASRKAPEETPSKSPTAPPHLGPMNTHMIESTTRGFQFPGTFEVTAFGEASPELQGAVLVELEIPE